ncbi:hypothetical protein Fmac_032957 [Flemingia macrophylla]|uniref:L-dopachrome isomerase n=1 Tax=Flemingia macrophylla TaxID=520843 RepID=A0ABD1L6G0_9FABA
MRFHYAKDGLLSKEEFQTIFSQAKSEAASCGGGEETSPLDYVEEEKLRNKSWLVAAGGKNPKGRVYGVGKLNEDAMPLSFVMLIWNLNGGVPIAFAGTQEVATYGELISIGGLGLSVNGKLSSTIAEILQTKLYIDKLLCSVMACMISSGNVGFHVLILSSFWKSCDVR